MVYIGWKAKSNAKPGRSIALLASLLDELCDSYVSTFAHAPPVELDSRDFVERLCHEIAGSAMCAANDWYFLNNKERRAFPIAPRHLSNLNASAATVFAAFVFTAIPHIQ